MNRSLHFAVGSAPAEAGARAYQERYGFGPQADRSHSIVTPDIVQKVARAYSALPEFDPKAVPAYNAMREEVRRQFDHLTAPRSKGGMGFDVSVADHDPYEFGGFDGKTPAGAQMMQDVNNRRMKVLSTAATGGHPLFSNDDNDMFRAVHDVFGHAAIGRGVDRHGEEAAFQKHAGMFSPLAQQALATETRGQNHAMIAAHGEFQPQKIAVMPAPLRRINLTTGGDSEARARALLQARQFHAEQFGVA